MYFKKTISIPLYDTKVKLIITPDILKVVNNFYKKHNTNFRYTDSIAGMMLTMSMDEYTILISTDFLTYNTIMHELFHCVMAITADRNNFEEENRAWVQGFIAQEIFNFIKNKGIKIE